MRDALGACSLLFLAGHCRVYGYTLAGAMLAAMPVPDLSANSLSSVIHCATPLRASRCVAANYDHLLVNTFVDFVRA